MRQDHPQHAFLRHQAICLDRYLSRHPGLSREEAQAMALEWIDRHAETLRHRWEQAHGHTA